MTPPGPDAGALRRVTFQMADPDVGTFEGWTDDTFWNGWLNVEVDASTHLEIDPWPYRFLYGTEGPAGSTAHHPATDADPSYAVGLWEALSGLEQLRPDENSRYSYSNCYCTREVVAGPS